MPFFRGLLVGDKSNFTKIKMNEAVASGGKWSVIYQMNRGLSEFQ